MPFLPGGLEGGKLFSRGVVVLAVRQRQARRRSPAATVLRIRPAGLEALDLAVDLPVHSGHRNAVPRGCIFGDRRTQDDQLPGTAFAVVQEPAGMVWFLPLILSLSLCRPRKACRDLFRPVKWAWQH